jgi:hypothetical protein
VISKEIEEYHHYRVRKRSGKQRYQYTVERFSLNFAVRNIMITSNMVKMKTGDAGNFPF